MGVFLPDIGAAFEGQVGVTQALPSFAVLTIAVPAAKGCLGSF
jgi:hypothetical protein